MRAVPYCGPTARVASDNVRTLVGECESFLIDDPIGHRYTICLTMIFFFNTATFQALTLARTCCFPILERTWGGGACHFASATN